jgi:DNA polymerase elongation subunit (family B)
MEMEHTFKLIVFNAYSRNANKDSDKDSDEEQDGACKNTEQFFIQMFGINELGETASIIVEEYKPFFYLKVGRNWGQTKKNTFYNHIRSKVGKYHENGIISCKLIEKKKLYGFDAGALHRFIEVKFENMTVFNRVKNLWYEDCLDDDGEKSRRLKPNGYMFDGTSIEIYEANIPALLRLFHIREISPSGWIALPFKKTSRVIGDNKTTSCTHEFVISYKNIIPLNQKEDRVPYKIMSFDIEASSSHGDFPVPVKSYKKLATNIVDYFSCVSDLNTNNCESDLREILKAAFGFTNMDAIDLVYPKTPIKSETELALRVNNWLSAKINNNSSQDKDNDAHLIETLFEESHKKTVNFTNANNNNSDAEDDDDSDGDGEDDDDKCKEFVEPKYYKIQSGFNANSYASTKKQNVTIVDILCEKKYIRDVKIMELINSLKSHFPALEGDKVTFIGSTFFRYGENEPYLNHCIALNSCDSLHNSVSNSQIDSYDSEEDVLVAWSKLVQEEDPDIVIGYNIFSFDYEFMFRRAQELKCVEEFLKLSRNRDEICKTVDYKTPNKIDIERSSTVLASGNYELAIIPMNGRLQVDMLNWFRRSENLTSYKLDYVAGHFIGDDVKTIDHSVDTNNNEISRIYTNNMVGLQKDSFIHFEEFNHSVDYYKNGEKFKVINLNKADGWFEVNGNQSPTGKKVKWGLAKDDVTPKDIFRMTNEGPSARSIIAKYCIQDCNLVHYLFNKVDVVTDLVEMAKLCSVPMSFLIFRGQGIKLTSYVAKKCREMGVLMPCIDKGSKDDGYEGAIVLDPKCGLYLEEAVCVGDFASLYPSSILSENLCPSSKVWTKIYDLASNLILETGIKDASNGTYLYDNLPNYEYVNVQFDTFKYVRKSAKAKAEKVKSGYKICRFAQPLINQEGKEEKAIMPSILQELLKARKDTRKLIPKTDDEFMKNILDKRQLAYKVTANSLYGQLGAKTSTFYEPDIAASTTATGRLLLTFAKRVVEECYADTDIETKYGVVNTKAEYVYGDTDSVFFKFNLTDKATGEKIVNEKALELSIEIAQEACHNVSKVLKQPHDFEYEKTFMPFCLLSKKRYVSIKYEFDPKKGKRNEMGIVLKRRDNAPIVKDIYGGVIDILMKEKNIQKAIDFVHDNLQNLVSGNVPIEKLVITKSLRSFYKNPQSIAHKVLADRIGQRDPGNKPTSGDRIPFVYIVNQLAEKKQKVLQGEKIETPSFIKDNNLPIDYSFYISNQIMKPLLQLFGLVLENIWLSQKPPRRVKVNNFKADIKKLRLEIEDDKKCEQKINKIKDKEVQLLIFDKYLRECNNAKARNQSVTSFFIKM